MTKKVVTSLRIEDKKRELLDKIAAHQDTSFNDIAVNLFNIYIDNYDLLFDIATDKNLTVMELMKIIVKEFINREDKKITI